MGTRRIRLLSNLRRRLGFRLGRSRKRTERLHLGLLELRAVTGDIGEHWQKHPNDSYELVPLLDRSDRAQRRDGPDHRPRSFTVSSVGPRSESWTMASHGELSITVTYDPVARYSDCE
jgi:hypothetical protein